MDEVGYFVECGDVLSNRLGITDSKELQETEYRISSTKTTEILTERAPKVPDLVYLLALHKKLFGDIYDFAGKFRSVNIAKPDSPVPFCYADFILPEAERIFGMLKAKNYLVGLEKPDFVRELAQLSSDLNALHPFREGNGRTIRLYLDQICYNAGYIINFANASHDEILNADKSAFAGDLNPLIQLYSSIVEQI